MLALAAARLGLKSHVFSDETECLRLLGRGRDARGRQYDDERALEKFAAACDVVTFEFENVPDATAHFLADHVPVAPNARVARHRAGPLPGEKLLRRARHRDGALSPCRNESKRRWPTRGACRRSGRRRC